MSKKKKAQEAAAMAAEQAARAEAAAKAAREANRPLTASFRVMNNCHPVPVAPAADYVQLTPVVQPISVSTYGVMSDMGYDPYAGDEYEEGEDE